MPSIVLSISMLVVAAAAFAPTAGAAVVVGPPDIVSGAANTHNCLTTCERAQYLEGTTSTASPVDGVIVRWRVRAESAGGAQISLRTYRAVPGPFRFAAVATGAPLTVAAGTTTAAPISQAVRVPIRAGDLVGVRHTGAVNIGFRIVTARGVSHGGGLADGSVGDFDEGGADRVLLNADVEPDADRDGFGDETQDACPTQATTQGPCVPPAGAASVAKVALAKNGRSFGVRVACGAGPKTCVGTLFARSSKRLRLSAKRQRRVTGILAFGEKRFSVAPGTSKVYSFKLSTGERGVLKRLRKFGVALTLASDGGTIVKAKGTIRAPKKKRR